MNEGFRMKVEKKSQRIFTRDSLIKKLGDSSRNLYTDRTVYITHKSLSEKGVTAQMAGPVIAAVVDEVKHSETGLVLFRRDDEVEVIEPPIPLSMDAIAEGQDIFLLKDLLSDPIVIGVVLLRLGRFAVGLYEGGALVASKTEGRYVKNRHRAGGSSQRRFERSRERLIRELFDKTCSITQSIFGNQSQGRDIDYVFMGGEKHTLNKFLKRCEYLGNMRSKILSRTLNVENPNRETLESVSEEIYKSKVTTYYVVR